MKKFLNIFIILTVVTLAMPLIVFAHQPRAVSEQAAGEYITVNDPEVSKAYYGQLIAIGNIYKIHSDKPFTLYANLLVPDKFGQGTDFRLNIFQGNDLLATLNGSTSTWTKFFEPFGHDNYLKGPEFRKDVPAGDYMLVVLMNTNHFTDYVLAIGEKEEWNLKEAVNSVLIIPKIKRVFFEKNAVDFILSPIGIGYIIIMFVIAFIVGFIYRYILKRLSKSSDKTERNIDQGDRWIRVILGVGALLLAIFTTWNPILLFISGFCFFEAIFSWCAVYSVLGKNSCPR
ncbi:MAG: DUF2892 domain-containing protein [Candidatus Buchananbacteria bacterium]|jgi:hypothetical protein